MAESSETEPTPVERLHDHLDEVDDRSDQMQERLDELGENIEATRRQAEDDDLLPTGDDAADAADGPPLDEVDWPEGDRRIETPVNDSNTPPVG
jgi:hypothetical protein